MWLIVGLGNPGKKYEHNRHNVGFMVADELARRHPSLDYRQRFGGDVAKGMLDSHKVVLLKPMEYMNLSGYATQRAASYFDVDPEHILVLHDEIDIDFGRVKLKRSGGHGGHNGLRSIARQLGSRDFRRIRIGVGKPPKVPASAGADDRRVSGWVLSNFPADDRDAVDALITRAADAAEAVVADGIDAAMNEFNEKAKKADNADEQS